MRTDLDDPPRPFTSIAFQTKAEAVYQELRARILDGSYPPGSVLNQDAVAAAMGLSITPLREALRRLESEGLVRLKAHGSLTVASLSAREVGQLYAVRLRLDPFAAELAAQEAPPEVLDSIDELASRETESTTLGRLSANRRFHQTIYRASGNAVLVELLDRLWDQTDRYRLLALQDEEHERAAERDHVRIAAAVRSRDGTRTAALMTAHVEATLRFVERHVDIR